MKTSTYVLGGSLVLFAIFIESSQPTCVLESDFGFKINCALKKSGLFRVRNLGGVKAHASIGFSLGDELGFEQSLTNQDPSRRRSVSLKNGAAPNIIGGNSAAATNTQKKNGKQNRIMMRPMAPPSLPNQDAINKLNNLHRRGSSTMRPIVVSGPTAEHPTTLNKVNPVVSIIKPLPIGTLPPFKPLPPKDDSNKPLSTRLLHVPQIDESGFRPQNPSPQYVHNLASQYPAYNTKKVDDYNLITGYGDDSMFTINKDDIDMKIAEIANAGNITREAVEAAIALRQQQLLNKYANIPMPTTSTVATTTAKKPVIIEQEPEPETIWTTQKYNRIPNNRKVMNAPREYYPVGYEKNFDDHFQTKVDLPETNFQCGDQKYFPGLYGDENLGCMVFHVCALTDEGLVMKSFLCPESTLFDQTIIKCNWWFYVDCKNTRKLYDTNIPVSKSYQLMKALTFFSSYNKETQEDGQTSSTDDVEGIKDAISIIQNKGNRPIQSGNVNNSVEIITPTPNPRKKFESLSPVYRGSINHNTNTTKISRMISAKTKAPEFTPNPELESVTVKADNDSNKTVRFAGNEIANSSASENTFEKKYRRKLKLPNSTLVNNTSAIVNESARTILSSNQKNLK